MLRFIFLFSFLLISLFDYSQDRMAPLGSNPSLFHLLKSDKGEKLLELEDSVVYTYDTLSLPFIDDFSKNHLPKRLSNFSGSNVRDTVLYKYYIGGSLMLNTDSFSADTTYHIQFGNLGDTVQISANPFVVLSVHDLSFFPPVITTQFGFPPYQINDTIGKGPDTLKRIADIFQDSAKFFVVAPNPNDFYTNRDVLVNNSFPLNPISYGVATFDGLNQYGLPYILGQTIKTKADYLSSVPINLSNVSFDTSVYFSFYFEPKGLSLNGPEPEDSLVLEFYLADENRWTNVWATGGFNSDTFKYVILNVPARYHQSGFRFRFRNYAQASGAYDQWHLDYIYLNENRSPQDTAQIDIAFQFQGASLLETYTAMPWWHFKTNPSNYLKNKTIQSIRNNYSVNIDVFFKLDILDTLAGTPYYRFPPINNISLGAVAGDSLNIHFPINFDYHMDSVKGPGVFKSRYDVFFQPTPSLPVDFIPSNDTIFSEVTLQNYYAYDDGTAEAGYGVNPQPSEFETYIAVRFDAPMSDTIGGVQIYFLPQYPDIRSQEFELTIWVNDLNPSSIVFSRPMTHNPLYSEDNGYVTYWLDSLVEVGTTFFVGFKAIGPRSLNVGYDLNNNNRDKIYWSYRGVAWNQPSVGIYDGSIMIRPVFRTRYYVIGVEENTLSKTRYRIAPNPANNWIGVFGNEENTIQKIELYSLSGNLVHQQTTGNRIDLSPYSSGLYLVRIIDKQGRSTSQKLIINR